MNERDVGANIRMWRERSRESLTALAKSAGMTKSTLSKIETGQISSPISTLIRVADAMGLPVAEFFIEPEPRSSHVFTPKGGGETVMRGGTKLGHSYEELALLMIGKSAEPFLITIHPGDPAGEFKHGGEEFFYVLSGRMEVTVGEESLKMRPGDSLYLDSRSVHSAKALGKTPVRFLCIYIPENLMLNG